jgi:hypothetical protein
MRSTTQFRSNNLNDLSARYNPSRSGHAPGHIRNALIDALDASLVSWTSSPWWKFLRGGKVEARRLIGILWNCRDIVPATLCNSLDLPVGRTFAQLVRILRENTNG